MTSDSTRIRAVSKKIDGLITNLEIVTLDPEPSKRIEFIGSTDLSLKLLTHSIRQLWDSEANLFKVPQFVKLHELSDKLTADWNAIKPKVINGLSQADKVAFFVKYSNDIKLSRATLEELQDYSKKISDTKVHSSYERLEFSSLLVATGLMIWIAITVCVFIYIFRLLISSQRANHDLASTKTALENRSRQLVEAQRLGKIGDWSYRLGESGARWGDELYELLDYDPETFTPTDRSVQELFIGNGAQLFLDAQSEVLRSGEVKSIDVKFKRGNGTIGDYVLTSKQLTDNNGKAIGIAGTIQDISERKDAEFQLEKLAYYDPLTGLANRAMFHREMNELLKRCERTDAQGALLLLDLDRFKDVNDSLGHAAGDELLTKVSHLISRALGGQHFLSRLGGDEFAIIIADCHELAQIEQIATDIVTLASEPLTLEAGEVNIGTSIGISLLPRDGNNASDLLRHADLALYRAKGEGRGRFQFFEPEMNTAVKFKTGLARDLRHAVSEDFGLEVHYQPQIDVSKENDAVAGYEALMRWNHPKQGPIPPSEFIPIAESSRLICDLGAWILRQSVMQASQWLEAGEPERSIAVNISAAQIWHMDLTKQVEQVLEETNLPPHLLCLELTESLFADHSEAQVRSVLNELKKLGVTLALDDFGTGFSSLGYLTQLPFDKLKIDRIFIDGVATSERAQELLGGIVALGRGLGMTVVGEGAERQEEVDLLRKLGCHVVQGYYFAKPTKADEALQFTETFEATRSKENDLDGYLDDHLLPLAV